MADQPPYCIHCGAQQLNADARFCHRCGRPIPAVTLQPAAPPEFPPARRRRLNPWWLLPPLLAVALAAAALAWEPARTRVSDAMTSAKSFFTDAVPPFRKDTLPCGLVACCATFC